MAENRTLEQLRHDVNVNCWWALILTSLWIVLVVVVFSYSWWEIKQMTKPEHLVDMAVNKIEANYPEARAELKEKLIQEAPRIAEAISHKAIASMPSARVRVETFLTRQIDHGLDQASDLSAEQFRKFLQENKDLVRDGYKELKDTPEEAVQFTIKVENRLENVLGTDIQEQEKKALSFLHGLNHKLERLHAGTNLQPDDLVLRRIVRILRAI